MMLTPPTTTIEKHKKWPAVWFGEVDKGSTLCKCPLTHRNDNLAPTNCVSFNSVMKHIFFLLQPQPLQLCKSTEDLGVSYYRGWILYLLLNTAKTSILYSIYVINLHHYRDLSVFFTLMSESKRILCGFFDKDKKKNSKAWKVPRECEYFLWALCVFVWMHCKTLRRKPGCVLCCWDFPTLRCVCVSVFGLWNINVRCASGAEGQVHGENMDRVWKKL